jgi:hypothetical protein
MTRYVHATYCDDIRQEVGGKITLVGIYAGQCIVPAVPCVLPKLCVVINLSAPRSEPITSAVVTGAFAGNEVFNMTLESEQISQIMAPSYEARPDGQNMMLMLMGVMSPFNVATPGKLTLNVLANGEEIFCESLEISVAPAGAIVPQ